MRRLFALSIVIAPLAACQHADSSQVPTSELSAAIDVLADGTGPIAVHASLWHHQAGAPPLNIDSVELAAGDQLVASSTGEAIAMTQQLTVVDSFQYEADFAAGSAGQSFQIALERAADASAPMSEVTLPAPFAIVAPSSAARSSAWTLTWSPSGSADAIDVRFDGACTSAELGPVADTGSLAIPAGTLVPTTSAQASSTCDVTLTMTRTRTGTLDPAYGQGGSIVAKQQRTATLTSSP